MDTHGTSVAPTEPAHVGHFERGGRHYTGTPKERAQELAQLPAIMLGSALAACETFRGYALEVAADENRADELARQYALRGVGRRVIHLMLVEASRAPASFLSSRLQRLGMRAVFVNAPLDGTDARYRLRAGKVDSLSRGAEVVARRGAGVCLGCGSAHDRDDDYCASCDPWPAERRRDRHDARELLRAVAEQVGIESDGPDARRVRRRVSTGRRVT